MLLEQMRSNLSTLSDRRCNQSGRLKKASWDPQYDAHLQEKLHWVCWDYDHIYCYIHVNRIVHKIAVSTEEGNYGKFSKQLKGLMFPVEIQGEYFDKIDKSREGDGFDTGMAIA